MLRSKAVVTPLVALVVLGGVAGGSSHASAQIAQIYGMPDLDQRRAGLPNDGNMHCAPTAAINMMAYISNNGRPAMMDGPRNWQSQAQHEFVSGNIFIMGLLMGTTGKDGTGGNGFENGIRTWVDDHAPGLFTVTRLSAVNGPHSVNPQTLLEALNDGSLVAFAYGRYRRPLKFEPPYERAPGHVVTLTLVSISSTPGLNPTIQYRDPATADGNLNMQSTFSTRTAILTRDTIPLTNGTSRTMWEMHFDPPPPLVTRRFMDSIVIVDPAFVLAPVEIGVAIHRPWRFSGSSVPMMRNIPSPQGLPISRAAIAPDQRSAIVTTRGVHPTRPQLWHLSLSDGEYTPLANLANDNIPVALSRHTGEVYFPNASGAIVRYATVPNDNGNPSLSPQGSHTPGSPIGAVSYRDDTDEVLVLLPTLPHVLVYPRTLGNPIVRPLIGFSALQGATGIEAGPVGTPLEGKYFVRAGQSIYQLMRLGVAGLALETTITPAGGTLTGFSMTDMGTMLIAIGGQVVEYHQHPSNGSWQPRVGSMFTGLPSVGSVAVSRSRSNYDPALHNIPGWENIIDEIDVPETPDCAADFNRDGVLNSQDFFDFLVSFFAQEAAAEFNNDGVINSQDFFDYLAAFFAGC